MIALQGVSWNPSLRSSLCCGFCLKGACQNLDFNRLSLFGQKCAESRPPLLTQEDRKSGQNESMSQIAADKRPNPLTYIIPLYFLQAMPVFLVQDVSKTIFKDLGVDNQQIATVTALIALPWSFKLLWGPIVELNGTKRRWINLMQLGIAALIVLAAFALQLPNFLGITLGVLAVTAIFSATCDIATDGYYLLATKRAQQAAYVGWQSTLFRLGRLFATGGIVVIAGRLHEQNGLSKPHAWLGALIVLALVYFAGALINLFFLPKPAEDAPREAPKDEKSGNILRAILVIVAFAWLYFGLAFFFGLVGHLISLAVPLFSKWNLAKPMDHYLFFYPVQLQADPILVHALNTGLGAVMAAIFGWLAIDRLKKTEMGEAFGTFFGQKDVWKILLFVLFYRFGEAMLGSIVPLFLQDKLEGPTDPTKGLAFTVEQVGLVNGTFGVVGIVLGGIIGGIFISKIGVRRSFWILAAAMNVPNLLYLLAALLPVMQTPQVMSVVMFFDQFGYGFGFAGYLICLQAVAQRFPQFTTAHYAIATGLGAFLIAAAGTLGGALMASVDFPVIFTIVLFFTIPCLLTLLFVPLRETEGIQVRNTDVAD